MYFVLAMLCTLLEGLVLKVLWGWFVSGYFGVPELTIPVAVGLSFMVNMVTYQSPKEEPDPWQLLGNNFLVITASFVMGTIAHMFM